MTEPLDLPTRTANHVMATASRRRFERAIPAGWTADVPAEDYGVDLRVEVYTPERGTTNWSPTGVLFDVQLKATQDESAAGRTIGIRWPTVAYWELLPHPVLVVRYLAATDQLFGIWVHDWWRRTAGQAHGQTARFAFLDGDELTEARIAALADEAIAYYAIRKNPPALPLSFTFATDSGDALSLSRTQVAINQIAPGRISLMAPGPESLRSITVAADRVEISLGGGLGASADTEDHLTERADGAAHLLALIALALCGANANPAALECLAVSVPNLSTPLPEHAAAVLGTLAMDTGRRDLVARIVELNATWSPDVAVALALGLRGAASESEMEQLERAMRRVVETATGRTDSARAQFNFGLWKQTTGDLAAAAKAFERALELDGTYGDRDYFWHTLAATHADLGEWETAAEMYERAVNLGDDPRTRTLFADSLMALGRYEQARDEFGSALDSDPESAHALLGIFLLDAIIDIAGIHGQARDADRARAIVDGIDATDPDAVAAQEALDADALLPGAWLAANGAGLVDERAFVIVAWLVRTDAARWAMAYLLTSAVGSSDNLLAAIANHAWFFVREDFESTLVDMALHMPEGLDLGSVGSPADIAAQARAHVEQARNQWRRLGDVNLRHPDGSITASPGRSSVDGGPWNRTP